ncbi:MAG: pilus assembly PilX N-terminal domain-containing protein [Caloramator sp.]|nr:pilus assembly PilX N-terminal domain-containing protein [Caloramator sp.]
MKSKKGSAMIYVILMLAVLFTISIAAMQMTLASLKQSSSFYQKNQAYYYADSSTEKILYFLDAVADEARGYANSYCYTPSGAPNLDNPEIKTIYENFLNDKNKDNYETEIRNIFREKYVEYLDEFFNNNSSYSINKQVKLGENSFTINGTWKDWKNNIKNILVNSDFEVDFKIVRDLEEDSDEYKRIFKNISKNNLTSYLKSRYPLETLLVKIKLKNSDVQRYMVTTFEFNPFREKAFATENKKIRRGYNGLFDYALISGRNIIIANGNSTLTIKGDIYAKGTGNRIEENKSYENYGGVLVGIDSDAIQNLKSNKVSENPTNIASMDTSSGNLIVEGNIYSGYVDESKNFISGFVRTVTPNSKIEVKQNQNGQGGDVWCHSIITDEKAGGSNIKVNNAYIADNVSLYAKNSEINIDNELISYEEANNNTNYNSSSSIVINDTTSKLRIGGRVILFGVAFVDELVKGNNPFKTLETTAINPNFIIYNYKILNNDNEDNIYPKTFYNDYYLKDNTNFKINLFEPILNAPISKSLGFVLDYLYYSKLNNENFDYQYDFGNSIEFNETKISESYFPYFLTANNKIYKLGSGNIESFNDLNTIKSKLTELKQEDGLREDAAKDESRKKKDEILKKIYFKDKELDSNSFLDYLDLDFLNSFPDKKIEIIGNKTYILIQDGDIEIQDLKNYDGYDVLLYSNGNITLNSSGETKIFGTIISMGDLIVKGKNITIEANKENSKKLLNYYSDDEKEDCQKFYRFTAKGITADDYYEQEIYAGLEEKAKTNILIKSKRQVVIK